jgi:hypothetical protein
VRELGLAALRRVKHSRWYVIATDPAARFELGALAIACQRSKQNLVYVLEVIAQTIPGWLQDRPPDDAGTVPELSIDKATGLRCRNPFLPLPPRARETTPRFDHASQNVIRELSPRLAKWLEDCAKNDGLPSMAMMDELAAEKLEAEAMRKIQYGDKEWQANALRGGMPWWKYISNRFLTFVENLLLGAKLSEYHTGYRAFARNLLERLPLETNSDDFVF